MAEIERLEIVRKVALELEVIQEKGVNYKRKYDANERVYCPIRRLFGQVVISDANRFVIGYDGDFVIYFRREHVYEDITQEQLLTVMPELDGKLTEFTLPKIEYEPLRRIENRFHWGPEEDKFLLANAMKPNQWLAEQLKTSVPAVKGRLHRLKNRPEESDSPRSTFSWTSDRDDYLVQNLEKSNRWLAMHLKTTVGSVKGRLRRLRKQKRIPEGNRRKGLKKTDE